MQHSPFPSDCLPASLSASVALRPQRHFAPSCDPSISQTDVILRHRRLGGMRVCQVVELRFLYPLVDNSRAGRTDLLNAYLTSALQLSLRISLAAQIERRAIDEAVAEKAE